MFSISPFSMSPYSILPAPFYFRSPFFNFCNLKLPININHLSTTATYLRSRAVVTGLTLICDNLGSRASKSLLYNLSHSKAVVLNHSVATQLYLFWCGATPQAYRKQIIHKKTCNLSIALLLLTGLIFKIFKPKK